MIVVLCVALGISVIVNIVQTVGLKNLTLKYEALEESNEEYSVFFETLQTNVNEIYRQMKSIDIRGAFESDDEVGVIYKGIRNLALSLTDFFEVFDGAKKDS